jgi:hypothetical protein
LLVVTVQVKDRGELVKVFVGPTSVLLLPEDVVSVLIDEDCEALVVKPVPVDKMTEEPVTGCVGLSEVPLVP